MKKGLRTASKVLVILVILAILYVCRLLPFPMVPILNAEDHTVAGFLFCWQLDDYTWYSASISGYYYGDTPLFGARIPLLYSAYAQPYCPWVPFPENGEPLFPKTPTAEKVLES